MQRYWSRRRYIQYRADQTDLSAAFLITRVRSHSDVYRLTGWTQICRKISSNISMKRLVLFLLSAGKLDFDSINIMNTFLIVPFYVIVQSQWQRQAFQSGNNKWVLQVLHCNPPTLFLKISNLRLWFSSASLESKFPLWVVYVNGNSYSCVAVQTKQFTKYNVFHRWIP